MARPRVEWEVEALDNGRFDLYRHRRPVLFDIDDLSVAVRRIKRDGGTSYVLIAEDGYRTTHRV